MARHVTYEKLESTLISSNYAPRTQVYYGPEGSIDVVVENICGGYKQSGEPAVRFEATPRHGGRKGTFKVLVQAAEHIGIEAVGE